MRRTRLAATLALGFTVLAHSATAGQAAGPAGRNHLRPLTADAGALIAAGQARSETFRRLVETLEQHAVVIWLEIGWLSTLDSQLAFVGASQAGPLLRITICPHNTRDAQVAWLAHELQHAVEVATSPAVTSAKTMAKFYAARGFVSAGGFCTAEAQGASRQVRAELRTTRGVARRWSR